LGSRLGIAALKAFTTVRNMISEKKIVHDNRTSLSDDESPMEVVPVMYRKKQR
jgi:hypothetical protein